MTTNTTDVLNQFNAVRDALKQEKERLEARFAEINRALGETGRARAARPRNELSLKEAVIQAVSKRPLTRHEVLEEVEKLGYKFASAMALDRTFLLLKGSAG